MSHTNTTTHTPGIELGPVSREGSWLSVPAFVLGVDMLVRAEVINEVIDEDELAARGTLQLIQACRRDGLEICSTLDAVDLAAVQAMRDFLAAEEAAAAA